MKNMIITAFLILITTHNYQFAESKSNNTKSLSKFEEVDKETGVYTIRYSNVIMKVKGKSVKIPIYGGIYEDITYEDLEKQQTNKEIYLLGNIHITVKDGDVKKTFYDILAFYKKSFFKDIDVNRPSVIGNEGGDSLYIWYDFEYEGMPCSMMITVAHDSKLTREKIKKIKAGMKKGEQLEDTLDIYEFKEDSKWIGIEIDMGKYSEFKKKSK